MSALWSRQQRPGAGCQEQDRTGQDRTGMREANAAQCSAMQSSSSSANDEDVRRPAAVPVHAWARAREAGPPAPRVRRLQAAWTGTRDHGGRHRYSSNSDQRQGIGSRFQGPNRMRHAECVWYGVSCARGSPRPRVRGQCTTLHYRTVPVCPVWYREGNK